MQLSVDATYGSTTAATDFITQFETHTGCKTSEHGRYDWPANIAQSGPDVDHGTKQALPCSVRLWPARLLQKQQAPEILHNP